MRRVLKYRPGRYSFLLVSIEMRESPSRLVDIKVLESGARDNHVWGEGVVIEVGRYQYASDIFCFHWNVGFRCSSQS